MKPTKLTKAWIKALLSGRFKQGRYALRTNNTRCCLGVLCDTAKRLNLTKGGWTLEKDGTYHFVHGRNFFESVPPNKFQILTGMSTQEMNDLVTMNDNYKKGFVIIAKMVAKWAGL